MIANYDNKDSDDASSCDMMKVGEVRIPAELTPHVRKMENSLSQVSNCIKTIPLNRGTFLVHGRIATKKRHTNGVFSEDLIVFSPPALPALSTSVRRHDDHHRHHKITHVSSRREEKAGLLRAFRISSLCCR